MKTTSSSRPIHIHRFVPYIRASHMIFDGMIRTRTRYREYASRRTRTDGCGGHHFQRAYVRGDASHNTEFPKMIAFQRYSYLDCLRNRLRSSTVVLERTMEVVHAEGCHDGECDLPCIWSILKSRKAHRQVPLWRRD